MSDEAKSKLYAALALAVANTSGVLKRGTNEQGQRYRYAKADDVVAEADRVLTAVGIAVALGRSEVVAVGQAEGKNGARTIFVLKQEFIVTHAAGGELRGEVCVGIGTNLNTGPAQAISSAVTGAERDFYRCLLRMPRLDEDDPDHPKNTRQIEERQEGPPPPARPSVAVPRANKATIVLRRIAEIETFAQYDDARGKWDVVLAGRNASDGCGYTDAEVASIKSALEAAKQRAR